MQHHSDRHRGNKAQDNELSDKPKQWLHLHIQYIWTNIHIETKLQNVIPEKYGF